jgi:DNA-directed RNA polymerase subunit RPC12/RpoP
VNHAVPATEKMVLVACPFCNCTSAMPSGSSSYKCAQCSEVSTIKHAPNTHIHT